MSGHRSETFLSQTLSMSAIESRFLPPGENLVGFGFRCWLGGYLTGDMDCWQRCWELFLDRLGSNADAAVADLSDWVNAIRFCGLREIDLLPPDCPSFCRDECLAVTLVAANRHNHCPGLKVCAYALLGADNIEPALQTAGQFGQTLEKFGICFDASSTPEGGQIQH